VSRSRHSRSAGGGAAQTLIEHLRLKDDDRAYFVRLTRNGNIQFQGLSARALHLARQALDNGLDVDEVTRAHNQRRTKARRR
jgi:hypothetical protein